MPSPLSPPLRASSPLAPPAPPLPSPSLHDALQDPLHKHVKKYDDWDFSPEGRIRQAQRMRNLADGVEMAGKIAVADFVCPTEKARKEFAPDYTVWMNTIKEGRFADTNKVFQKPTFANLVIDNWDYDVDELVKLIQHYANN